MTNVNVRVMLGGTVEVECEGDVYLVSAQDTIERPITLVFPKVVEMVAEEPLQFSGLMGAASEQHN